MTQTSRNLGFMIDNNIAAELEEMIPSSQRSKFVSQAIANGLSIHRRNVVVTEMLEHCV